LGAANSGEPDRFRRSWAIYLIGKEKVAMAWGLRKSGIR